MFKEVIDMLLEKKANLNANKEAELEAFMNELEAKYVDTENRINKLLDEAGYVEPVAEEAEEIVEEEVVEEVAEEVVSETTEEDWR